MPLTYNNDFEGGNWLTSFFKSHDTGILISIVVMNVLMIILLIVVIAIVASKKEGFRGIGYTPGHALFPDISPTMKVGDVEYANPRYEAIADRWVPTETKFGGYTVWRLKEPGEQGDGSKVAEAAAEAIDTVTEATAEVADQSTEVLAGAESTIENANQY